MYMYRLYLLVEALAYYFTAAQPLTISLQRVQPATSNQACPGNEVVFTCIVTSPHSAQIHPFLIWFRPLKPKPLEVIYHMGTQHSAPLGDIATTAVFENDYYTIISNATIKSASLLHSNRSISCYTPSLVAYLTEHIKVAGADDSPSELSAAISSIEPQVLALTWLPPPSKLNCSFNYTVNITNGSSVTEQMYINNRTSLILTLTNVTRGENYSFAVAVTDSTGQHGPWSEELMVTWDEAYYNFLATTTAATAAATCTATTAATLHADVTTNNTTTTTLIKVVPVSSTQHTLQLFVRTPSSSPNGTENKKVEDLFVHIISVSSGLLLICISLFAAMCIVLFCVQKRNTKKQMSDHVQQEMECSRSAGDVEVVYDIPIFKNDQENQSVFQNTGKMIMHQNTAYDCISPAIDDGKVCVLVSTNKLEGQDELQYKVTDKEMVMNQNVAYEQVPTH